MERVIIPALRLAFDGRLIEPLTLSSGASSDDPLAVALSYREDGADELFISVGTRSRLPYPDIIERLANAVPIPLTVQAEGKTAEEFARLLDAGVTRVASASSALENPDLIATLARNYGSEAVAISFLSVRQGEYWRVAASDASALSEWEAVAWARVAEAQGAGTVILGCRGQPADEPFDLELLSELSAAVSIAVLADGEAHGIEDVFDALMIGNADGVLLRSLLHSGTCTVQEIRAYLNEHGLPG